MIIKKHLCGIAVAYEPNPHKTTSREEPRPGRPNGSLVGRQKRLIADACEYLRLNHFYKPRIFVATTPGELTTAEQPRFISKFVHNLRNGYGMKEFVWVREYTKKGFPHFHFIADVDQFDPVKLSLYWSNLFGINASNSIRLGSKPNKHGKRSFWISSDRHAWYLTKYLGKSFDEKKVNTARRFAVSNKLQAYAQPVIYEATTARYVKKPTRVFSCSMDSLEAHLNASERPPALQLNPYEFKWSWTGHGQTFIGVPKKWRAKAL